MSTDPDPRSTGMPEGPWLTVLGMHRSGTSAVTGVLGGFGFATPQAADRMHWPESNPEHWESSSLTVYNDGVLAALGGSWDAPPDFAPGWQNRITVRSDPHPAELARRAFPDPGPVAWKDPRLCLLLPYWQRILPPPHAFVFIWRRPLRVADSLRRRDGMHLADGVALWERYNRSALEHLAGSDTYVCSYESLVTDPARSVGALADWLRSLPQFADHAIAEDPERAVDAVTDEHPVEPPDPGGLLLEQHHELVSRLVGLEGAHHPLGTTVLASESPWTTALLTDRRGSRTRELEGLELQLHQRQLTIDHLHASLSWRVTAPLRTIVGRFRGVRA